MILTVQVDQHDLVDLSNALNVPLDIDDSSMFQTYRKRLSVTLLLRPRIKLILWASFPRDVDPLDPLATGSAIGIDAKREEREERRNG